MELRFEKITEQDVPDLTDVMTRAFDDDAQKHLGVEKGGPEGYDNGEFFRKWLFPYDESEGYKILFEGRIVGGLIVWVFEHGNNTLGTIFIDPAFQDRGIGARAWDFIELTYPDAKSWTLGTPSYATKNHHFYETKCGFVKVKEEPAPEHPGTSFIYRKVMESRRAEVTIERADVEDAEEILDLQKLAYQSEAAIYDDYAIPPLTQMMEEITADFERQVFLKASVDERIIGSVRANQVDDTCFIGRLIVHPELQNRGIGTRLMGEIEKTFGQVKRYELFTGNKSERNLYLYQKLGYEPFKTQVVTQDLTLVFLEKRK